MQVIFEGIKGQRYTGDIAIDDVQFTVGSCNVLPSSAQPNNPWTTPAVSTTSPTTVPTAGKQFLMVLCTMYNLPFACFVHNATVTSSITTPACKKGLSVCFPRLFSLSKIATYWSGSMIEKVYEGRQCLCEKPHSLHILAAMNLIQCGFLAHLDTTRFDINAIIMAFLKTCVKHQFTLMDRNNGFFLTI